MPLRDAYYPLLADPSPGSWLAICRLLDHDEVTDERRVHEAGLLLDELRAWPPEIERPSGKRRGQPWTMTDGSQGDHEERAVLLKLCRTVAEKDLYPLYVDAAASSPLLRLRDGAPAVRLQRQFTGALQGSHGRIHRVGQEGQGDLSGSLCVEFRHLSDDFAERCRGESEWRRLSVALEVEVKRDAGKMRPAQVTRQEALRRRGEIYVVVRRTEEMVLLLVAERDRVLVEIGARS